jgi:ABC-type transport system involved in multi-copper enzyme maturation permease subunit
VMLTAGLFVYGVSTASFAAFFGMSTGKPYIYAVGGVVRVMSFPLYNFAYLYASLITVFVLMMFAYMLSIMTKNTAASVGISIGVYFGGSIVHSLLISLASGEWLKFLPFTNISPETKIFPDNTTSQIAASVTQANTSLTFSLVYIAVLVFLIGYIGFDSFTRQDIK